MRHHLAQLIKRLTPGGTVVQQTTKSGIWRLATKVSSRGFELLMLLILARLLRPRDFGLLGIALLTLSATKRFTTIGLNAALIQHKDENVDDYLDTTWCLEFGRGILIAAVLIIAAPGIAALFGEPQATDLIRVLALAPLLFGFRNPAVVYFKKDLAFHKDFLYRASGGFTMFAVGVGYALVSPTVWALIFAFLARDVSQFLLSYVFHPYRPWFSFDLGAAKELIDYGKWITGSSIVMFLYNEGDDTFVGWYLTATALGFYQYSYRLADAPSTEVSEVVSQVMFPAFSKLQDDAAQLRTAVLQTTRFTSFLAFPMSFGIILVAPSFVPAVLGPDWLPMIPILQILAIYGLSHGITRHFGSLWKAVGRPDLTAKLLMVGVIMVAITIWPATARWGVEGTALAVTGVSVLVVLPLGVHITSKLIVASPVEIYREYMFPFLATLGMFVPLWYARGFLTVHPAVELVLLVPAGAIMYLFMVLLIDRQFDWGMTRNLRMVFDGIVN